MADLIKDQDKAMICTCGSTSYALRGDGFCECQNCHKIGNLFWDRYDGEVKIGR